MEPRKNSIAWSEETKRLVSKMPDRGIFMTGIENSDPYVKGVRRDQLKEAFDFYNNFEKRLEKIKSLGINWVRFGHGYSQVHVAEDKYSFDFTDKVIKKCDELGITLVADLLHFGMPEWIHGTDPLNVFFQNPRFPEQFAKYARMFAKRYPSIKYFTIINEPFVTAVFSAKFGWWNEHISAEGNDDKAFVRACANIAKGILLAKKEIESVWEEEVRNGEPIFFQNESFERVFATVDSGREAEAEMRNLRRFVVIDLAFGHRDESMKDYLLMQGMSEEEYEWFMKNGTKSKSFLGIDHYFHSVRILEKDKEVPYTPDMPSMLYELAIEYWERYQVPMVHMEVNAMLDFAINVCTRTYNDISRLRIDGYPVVGMSWFGDEYQVDWDEAMRELRSIKLRLGLFYEGQIDPVGELFSRFAKQGLPPIEKPTETRPDLVPA